jgi:hypothetical protein
LRSPVKRRPGMRGLACCLACQSSPGLSRIGYRPFAGIPVPAWQVDPRELLKLATVAKRSKISGLGGFSPYYAQFGALGLSPTADAITSKVASTAVGTAVTAGVASAIGTGAAAGSIAGPIGAAAGALVALAVSLFQKNYFNVASSDEQCQQVEALWEKYLAVAGHVAGRALGWPTMVLVFHGAVGEGLFPGNNMHLQFHEGTLQCAGTGTWVDEFLGDTIQMTPGPACGAENCMANALERFRSEQSAIPSDTPDAVYFVDSILLPMNQSAQIPWVYQGAQNAEVHQLLYDLADAYLAQNGVTSTPYVKYPAASSAAAAPAKAPATPAVSVTTGAKSTPAAAAAPQAATPAPAAAGSTAPLVGSTAAAASYSAPPVGSTAPALTAAPAAAAVSSGLSTTEWLLIVFGVGALAFAMNRKS